MSVVVETMQVHSHRCPVCTALHQTPAKSSLIGTWFCGESCPTEIRIARCAEHRGQEYR